MITFHSLTDAQLMKIVLIQLAGLRTRLAERHIEHRRYPTLRSRASGEGGLRSHIRGAAAEAGYPQKEVETPLARRLVGGEIRDGQNVRVDLSNDHELTFQVESAAHAEAS